MDPKQLLTAAEFSTGIELWQIALLAALGLAVQVYYTSSTRIDVPAVGVPFGLFGSWRAALSWVSNSDFLLREGLRKYGKDGTPFKVSTPARWLVFITNPKILREVKDSEEHLSFADAINERAALQYTLSKDLYMNPYHLDIISKKLTQRLTNVLPTVVDEITMAFDENTNIGSEWTGVNNWNVMLKCISRASNRLYVGIPLCRNQDYLDKVIEYSTTASRAGATIDMFPRFLQRAVSKVLLNRDEALGKVMKYVGPIFQERQDKLLQLGDEWLDRPSDAIQWILEASPTNASLEELCIRILFLNWASIHTSSMTITHVLLDLAAYPEYQDPLKEEIESVLKQFGGWKKQALTYMKKLDSVLRESQRLNGINIATVFKKAKVSHTLSDGTYLPKGTYITAPASAIHRSDVNYQDAMKFDGFRFSRMREQPGSEAKYQAISTTDDFLAFGHGRHACPGRFFAANELKVLLAYIICNYEFKTSDGKRPENGYFGIACIPSISTELLFKERPNQGDSPVNVYRD